MTGVKPGSLPNRRPCITEDVDAFAVTVSYLPDLTKPDFLGAPIEVFITKRAKSGSELECHQFALGVAISKLMQGELGGRRGLACPQRLDGLGERHLLGGARVARIVNRAESNCPPCQWFVGNSK